MAKRRYLNFDLLLEEEGDGEYQARVIASPLKDHRPRVKFRLPFDSTTLELLLYKLDPGQSGTRSARNVVLEKAAKAFGGPLYDSVFTGDLALAWNESVVRAGAQGADGLRLRLWLNDAPELTGLPWELLYNAKNRSFFAQSEGTPVVRFLDVAGEPQPIQVEGPLRVLAIISSPEGLDELDVEREWARIKTAMAEKVREGLVVLERLPEATTDELSDWLMHHETHVIHFVGHGDFNPSEGEGFIYFQDERGEKEEVTADALGPFVRDHPSLRLIVLNACRSARTSPIDPYGGLAQGLVLRGAMAVVAMQFPISDQAAVKFTGLFYSALAAGLPVDQAVGYARKTMQPRFRAEWATPVLFMRSPDGNIFEHVQPPEGWVPPASDDAAPDHISDAIDAITDEAEPEDDAADDLDRDQAELEDTEPGVDPYGFLYEPDGHDTDTAAVTDGDTTDPDTDTDTTDTTDTDTDGQTSIPPTGLREVVVQWSRGHVRLLAVASAVLVVLIGAVIVASRLFSDPSLPANGALTNTQLLVAAGSDFRHLAIYLVDEDDPAFEEPLTQPPEGYKDWLPVLSDDGESMIYVREHVEDRTQELRTAAAVDGSGDRALFDPSPPVCSSGASRPAWIPGTDDLIVRCREDEVIRLVRVTVQGDLVQELVQVGAGEAADLERLGDPTVSNDGETVVFWASENDMADGGALYQVDLDSADPRPALLLPEEPGFSNFSDAVFSPTTNDLAFRVDVLDDADPQTDNFEVFVAPFDQTQRRLGTEVRISDDPGPARDQDPMFSPSGRQLVYGHEFWRGNTRIQQLWKATVEDPSDRDVIDWVKHNFYAVPAWSLR